MGLIINCAGISHQSPHHPEVLALAYRSKPLAIQMYKK